MKTKSGISLDLLKVMIGIFFVLLGIFGILPMIEEGDFSLRPSGQGGDVLEVLFGCAELVCGLLILLSLFTFFPKKIKELTSLLICLFWLGRIIIAKLVLGVQLHPAGIFFLPDFGQWLLILSAQLLIAAALWLFYQNSKA